MAKKVTLTKREIDAIYVLLINAKIEAQESSSRYTSLTSEFMNKFSDVVKYGNIANKIKQLRETL